MTAPSTSEANRQALYAEAAAEQHPAWCDADPLGCSGFHVSAGAQLAATDKDGELPLHVFATYGDATDVRGVEILFEFEAGPVSVTFTPEQAAVLATALNKAIDVLGKPWDIHSWTLEDVQAYGEAVLSAGVTTGEAS